MEKYKFENNRAVVDLPSIITISSTSVSIEHAGSTDTASIPDNADLTIQIGNIESYNPTSLPSEPAPEITPQQPENNEEPGDDNPTNPENPGDDNPTTPSAEAGYLVLNNTSNEDIYITGFIMLSIISADRSKWAPIRMRIGEISEGSAKYKISANTVANVSLSNVNMYINDPEPGETVSLYNGGTMMYDQDGITPVYCRVYSWTDAEDPAVIRTQWASEYFYENGPIVLNLLGINHEEGNITPDSNPIILS